MVARANAIARRCAGTPAAPRDRVQKLTPCDLFAVTGGILPSKGAWVAVRGLAGWMRRFQRTVEGHLMVQKKSPSGDKSAWQTLARAGTSRGGR